MKCIQIFKDGKMDELNIPSKNYRKYLVESAKSLGDNELTKIYSWEFEDSIIYCYGWYDGDNGFENSHDLPHGGMSDFIEEDSSEKILYGDIFIIRYQNDEIIDITISDYSVFYSDRFENLSNYSSDNDDLGDYNDTEVTETFIDDTDLITSSEPKTDDLDYDNFEY